MLGNVSTHDELLSVGVSLPRIIRAEPLQRRLIRVEFKTGESRIVDLAPVLESRRIFIPLRKDDSLFAQLSVNEDGNALEWPGEIEISAVWIYRLPGVEFSNTQFREAMDNLGFSLDGMANALGISRRQVADFRKDKPVPRAIALAVRYLLLTAA